MTTNDYEDGAVDASTGVVVGIDATNLRSGGGRTHLIELLSAADPLALGVSRVVVWGGRETLATLEDRPWLIKINPPALEGGLLRRTGWQRWCLSRAAREAGCVVLWIPGGSYSGDFHPVVTMSRNMLPFEWRELRRYGWSRIALRLCLLRWSQGRALRRAEGVIFLTDFARREVIKVTGPLEGRDVIIPHGLSRRFVMPPKRQKPIDWYGPSAPYRLLYVSIVDQYKHPWHVVEAVARLRMETGWPLTLDLAGPAYEPALLRLNASLQRHDPAGEWAHYRGPVPYGELHSLYASTDLGIFASSCENMPNILLETMSAGLPVACSKCGPMPEILREAGVYFDPERPEDIAHALRRLIASPALRTDLAGASYAAAQHYTWERCAEDTLRFLVDTCRAYHLRRSSCVA